MKRTIALISLLLTALLQPLPLLAEESPHAMLEALSVEMLDALEAERATVHERPDYLFELVEKTLVKHVDLERMARWVLGKHWRTASAEQRERFNNEFRTLLVRFYVTALLDKPSELDNLLAHREGLIVFQPVRLADEEKKCVARATVNLPDGRQVPVLFQMHRYDGPWQVYDISVENISLIKLYRDNFSSSIQKGGLEALLEELEERNARLLAGAKGMTGIEPSPQPAAQ